jgi:hypothetical protein
VNIEQGVSCRLADTSVLVLLGGGFRFALLPLFGFEQQELFN